MTNYAIVGVGGYIAPRHVEAVYNTGGKVLFAYDPNDSVGFLDKYDKDIMFYTNDAMFKTMLKENLDKIDYLIVCSPNNTHYAWCEFALTNGIDVICEKPLSININDIMKLNQIERNTTKKVYPILQLRIHPEVLRMKEFVQNLKDNDQKVNVDITYHTPRGKWYYASWNNNKKLSGGLAMNIGVHFFDLIEHVIGEVDDFKIHTIDD